MDTFGFREVPNFQRPENYLKAAEMAMEDDLGMIDGITNNGRSATNQTEKKPSVVAGIMECYKGWDEYAAKMQFVDAAFYSTCYMILERCGYHPRSMYEPQDFGCVPSFYTPNAMNTLGEAIRSVGNQVLDVIEKTISKQTAQKNNVSQAEGKQLPSAFLKPKTNKKEMEVR